MRRSLPHAFLFILILAGLAAPVLTCGATVQEEADAIRERVRVKHQAGETSEAQLAPELNDLSDLQQKYRGNRVISAGLLLMRAQIYEQAIQDKEMAMMLYEQVAADYPGTEAGYIAASTVDAARATADDAPPPQRSSASASRPASGRESTSAGRSNASSARSSTSDDNSRPTGTPTEGNTFPDFSVKDIDDAPVSLSQFAGQIILIDFWAAYNEDSVSNIDAKMSIYRRYHDKGFEIIGINRDRDRAPMINFINERGITWPQIYDQGGQLSRRYSVSNVPASFLLDREGKVLATNVDLATLVRLLDRQITYGY